MRRTNKCLTQHTDNGRTVIKNQMNRLSAKAMRFPMRSIIVKTAALNWWNNQAEVIRVSFALFVRLLKLNVTNNKGIMFDTMESPYDGDEDFEQSFQDDQRKIYAGGRNHTCPDCGRENALTDEQKRRGYHCDRCTRQTEEGW